jgi:hypothetical protein
MIDKKQFLKCLYAYVDFFLWCEDELRKHFHFDGISWLNQKITGVRGSFDIEGNNFEFHFHGSGCSITYKSLQLHYDVYITLEDYLEISPWKFMRFMVTYLNLENEIQCELIVEYLSQLNGTGPVTKINENYEVYSVSFAWYKAYPEQVKTWI